MKIVGYILPFLVGISCIIIGITNRKGNISPLHSYHRHRVAEEDVIPFGKMVGNGMIIIGISVALMGISVLVSEMTGNAVFTIIGTVVMLAGLSIGMGISFFAMKKYNKGIF